MIPKSTTLAENLYELELELKIKQKNLDQVVERNKYNLLSEPVLTASKDLDKLIVKWLLLKKEQTAGKEGV